MIACDLASSCLRFREYGTALLSHQALNTRTCPMCHDDRCGTCRACLFIRTVTRGRDICDLVECRSMIRLAFWCLFHSRLVVQYVVQSMRLSLDTSRNEEHRPLLLLDGKYWPTHNIELSQWSMMHLGSRHNHMSSSEMNMPRAARTSYCP